MTTVLPLVSELVPVTRETLTEAVETAAMACARGPVQLATVVELIAMGRMPIFVEPIPVYHGPHRQYAVRYGRARLASASWRNLKKRLKTAGFVIQHDAVDTEVRMYWTTRRSPWGN